MSKLVLAVSLAVAAALMLTPVAVLAQTVPGPGGLGMILQQLGETPTATPTVTLSEQPTETTTEAPTETPTETPTEAPTETPMPTPEPTSLSHDEILSAFHEQKDQCQGDFFAVLDSFLSEKDEIVRQIQEAAQSDDPDKESLIAELEAQKDDLEAAKDEAEDVKDACIEEAEAAKDAALGELEQDEGSAKLSESPSVAKDITPKSLA